MLNTCLIIFILFKSIFPVQYYFQQYNKLLQNECNSQIHSKSLHPDINKVLQLLLFKANIIKTYDDNSKTFSEHVLRLFSLVTGASESKRSFATRLEYRK